MLKNSTFISINTASPGALDTVVVVAFRLVVSAHEVTYMYNAYDSFPFLALECVNYLIKKRTLNCIRMLRL